MFFAIQPRCQHRLEMLPEPPQKLPSWAQNGNLASIMAHLTAIVPHLGRNLPPTLRQPRPSYVHLRPTFARNFHQIAPCTRRSAPRAPKLLPALKLPRFLTLPEVHLCRFWVPLDTHSPHYAIKASSDSIHYPSYVFPWASSSRYFHFKHANSSRTWPNTRRGLLQHANSCKVVQKGLSWPYDILY